MFVDQTNWNTPSVVTTFCYSYIENRFATIDLRSNTSTKAKKQKTKVSTP